MAFARSTCRTSTLRGSIGTGLWSMPSARAMQKATPGSHGSETGSDTGNMCMSGYPLPMFT